MYANGEGVPKDFKLALMWTLLAISTYTDDEKDDRGDAEENRSFYESALTRAQIIEAERMARDWKPKPGTFD